MLLEARAPDDMAGSGCRGGREEEGAGCGLHMATAPLAEDGAAPVGEGELGTRLTTHPTDEETRRSKSAGAEEHHGDAETADRRWKAETSSAECRGAEAGVNDEQGSDAGVARRFRDAEAEPRSDELSRAQDSGICDPKGCGEWGRQ